MTSFSICGAENGFESPTTTKRGSRTLPEANATGVVM